MQICRFTNQRVSYACDWYKFSSKSIPTFQEARWYLRARADFFEFIETGETLTEFLDEFPSVSRELAQGVLQEVKQAVVHAHSA